MAFDRKLGNRGGAKDRPSKRASFTNYLDKAESKGTSTTARLGDGGIYLDKYLDQPEGVEREVWLEDYRQSLSDQLHLRLLPQVVEETRIVTSRQLDHKHFKETGEVKLITITDEVVVRMSDKTLLRKGNPFKGHDEELKRVTSVTKRVTRPDSDFVEPQETRRKQ